MVRDRAFYRDFFAMWIVLVLQNVITLSVNLADNMMLGAHSEKALAGVAAVNQIQFVYQYLLLAVGEAVVIIGTQYYGKKQLEPVRTLVKTAMWTGAALSVVLFLLASVCPRQLMLIFTTDEPVIAQGMEYLRVIRFTYLIFAVIQILLYFLRIPVLSVYQLEPETRQMADSFLTILSVIMVTMSYQMPVNGGIIRGGGDIRYATILDLVSIWCIVIPVSWLMAFVFHASPVTVVWCLNADQIFKAVPAFLKCNFGHWAKKLTG